MVRNQPTPIHLDWIDTENQKQVLWAQNYLRKKGIPLDFSLDNTRCMIAYPSSPNDGLDRKMRYAWAQKKRRMKSDLKPYSFFMSKDVGPALSRLSERRGRPISLALQALILEEKDLAAEYKKQLEKDKREYREKYNTKGLARLRKYHESRDSKRVAYQTKVVEQQWKVIEELIHQIATNEALGQFANPSCLPTDKVSETLKRQEELLEYYRDRIESTAGFPAHPATNEQVRDERDKPPESSSEPDNLESAAEPPSSQTSAPAEQEALSDLDQEPIDKLKRQNQGRPSVDAPDDAKLAD